MDRAPLEQRGQPQPIFPNEMLHERKHKQLLQDVHRLHIHTF